MNWLGYLAIGYFVWSISLLIDRYALLDKVKSKKLYTLLPALTHIFLALLIIPFFGLEKISFTTLLLFLFAGFLEFIVLYYLFVAISLEDVSKILPLETVLASLITLFLSWVLLKDVLVGNEWIAFFLFLISGLILSFKFDKKRIKLSKAIKPLLILALIGSFSGVTVKHLLNTVEFWTMFFYSRFGLLVSGVLLLFFTSVRKEVFTEWQGISKNLKLLLIGNQFLAVFGYVFVFLALNLTNVALISSASGLQQAMIFIMVLILSRFNPELLQEDLSKNEVIKKTIGIALIIIAIYILNI